MDWKFNKVAGFEILNVGPNVKIISLYRCHRDTIDLNILPPNLYYLKITFSNFNNNDMKKLPSELKILRIHIPSDNSITELENLPSGLEKLYLDETYITNLDYLPDSLRVLVIIHNKFSIQRLENLPSSLIKLDCRKCGLTNINIPQNLHYLICDYNDLTQIHQILPKSLKFASFKNNELISRPIKSSIFTQIHYDLVDVGQNYMVGVINFFDNALFSIFYDAENLEKY